MSCWFNLAAFFLEAIIYFTNTHKSFTIKIDGDQIKKGMENNNYVFPEHYSLHQLLLAKPSAINISQKNMFKEISGAIRLSKLILDSIYNSSCLVNERIMHTRFLSTLTIYRLN
jgi:hypothetical protein